MTALPKIALAAALVVGLAYGLTLLGVRAYTARRRTVARWPTRIGPPPSNVRVMPRDRSAS